MIKCSGFYEPRNKQGVFVDNASIDFDSREIYGDSIFLMKIKDTQAFQITSNLTQMKTLFLMVSLLSFSGKDSAIITKNPLAINILKNDSLFIKADTLLRRQEDERKMGG